MKKITLFTAIAMIAFTVNTFGQETNGSTAEGTSTVTVIEPLEIVQTQPLDFGEIAAYDTEGTYVLVADGSPVASNVKVFTPGTLASFNVTGDTSREFTVTLPESVSLDPQNGVTAEAMIVSGFTQANGTSTEGTTPVAVGATLAVGANQPAAVYSGSYTVTVQYQ